MWTLLLSLSGHSDSPGGGWVGGVGLKDGTEEWVWPTSNAVRCLFVYVVSDECEDQLMFINTNKTDMQCLCV